MRLTTPYLALSLAIVRWRKGQPGGFDGGLQLECMGFKGCFGSHIKYTGKRWWKAHKVAWTKCWSRYVCPHGTRSRGEQLYCNYLHSVDFYKRVPLYLTISVLYLSMPIVYFRHRDSLKKSQMTRWETVIIYIPSILAKTFQSISTVLSDTSMPIFCFQSKTHSDVRNCNYLHSVNFYKRLPMYIKIPVLYIYAYLLFSD